MDMCSREQSGQLGDAENVGGSRGQPTGSPADQDGSNALGRGREDVVLKVVAAHQDLSRACLEVGQYVFVDGGVRLGEIEFVTEEDAVAEQSVETCGF
ncbi:hypothetical protein BJF79_08625 [Actinomadura sp. CNU-125]|nr:hypothetical protein BJF79_08625 [Actinomadura sp. CNU-125]